MQPCPAPVQVLDPVAMWQQVDMNALALCDAFRNRFRAKFQCCKHDGYFIYYKRMVCGCGCLCAPGERAAAAAAVDMGLCAHGWMLEPLHISLHALWSLMK
eukprot:520105-Pelagomonas_calceolata.AAC.1